MNRVLLVLAALALAVPARGQAPDQFLSVPARPGPAPAAPRPAPTSRPAPTPATVPPLPVGSTFGDKGFHCPANGTVVIREAAGRSSSLPYGGADPADPHACLMTVNGKVGSYLFGMVEKDSDQAADFAAAYNKVLTGPPGTVAEFLQKEGRFGFRSSWNYHFANEALEALQVGGQTRPTIRIAVAVKGQLGNSFEGTWHRWFDVQTGAVIQQSFQLVHGDAPKDQDWTASRIIIPKP
jgi:hypothetical protein